MALAALPWLFFASCSLFSEDPKRALRLPEAPDGWLEVLGPPSWQIEWFDSDGQRRRAFLAPGGALEIAPPGMMASPVFARPYWPELGIAPGIFRPAGAIFPFDFAEGALVLTWQGGVEAAFFMELAQAAGANVPSGASADLRLPWNFSWPRFRRLFDDPALNERVRADPWLANWQSIAERTVQAGFDRRRLVPAASVPTELPLGKGPWVAASPFAPPAVFEGSPAFSLGEEAGVWASAEGLLRAGTGGWLWTEF